MNIVIIGAGALGSYFGGRLQQAGQHVQYLVRKNRAKQLKENGISITSPHGNYQFNDLHITENVNDIEKVDLVILAVKGQHLQGTLTDLKVLVEKGAKVLPLLNGLEHISILQDELGDEAVLGGSAFIIATLDEKGHVIHSNDNHDLIYGPLHPSQKKICDEFEQAAGSAIMKARQNGKHIDQDVDQIHVHHRFLRCDNCLQPPYRHDTEIPGNQWIARKGPC